MSRLQRRYVLPLVHLLLVGTAWAEPSCQTPFLSKIELMTLPPDVREKEVARLMQCVKKSLTDLKIQTKSIEGLEVADVVSSMTAERDALKRLLAEQEKRLISLEPAFKESVRERDHALSEAAKLNVLIKAAHKALRALELSMEEKKVKISSLDADVKKKTEEIDGLTKEKEQADQKMRQDHQTILGLNGQISDLHKMIATLVQKKEACESKIAELEHRISQFAAKEAEWAKERTRSQEEKQSLIAERDKAVEALRRFKEQNLVDAQNHSTLLKELVLRSEDVMNLKKELSECKAEKARLNQALTDALLQRDGYRKDVEKLQDDLKKLNDEASRHAKEAAEEIARLKKDLGNTKVENEDLKKDLGNTKAENEGLKKDLGNTKAENEGLKKDLGDAKVENEDLKNFRSAFFAKLKEKLSKYNNIRVQGDRFIIETEVCFAVGSADLNEVGKAQMHVIGKLLKDIASEVPPGLNWVLQVNGHTDVQKMLPGSRFASNWELSTARALSVVKLLQADGAPARNLAAAGFGEFHPLDSTLSEAAYRKNRRIELKITDDGPMQPKRVSSIN